MPSLAEHRHLRGYCVHPTGDLVPSPFLLEGWHGALNLCVALLQTTEGVYHDQALQQVLALLEKFWPLILAPLQCQGPRRSGTSGAAGTYPRVRRERISSCHVHFSFSFSLVLPPIK